MNEKRIRTNGEQAFIDVCEIAFDYGIADELTKEEIDRYERLCNETVMKRHRFRSPKDQTMTKEQAILYLKEVLYTWKNWKVHHKYLALAIETLLEEVK